MVRVLLPLPLCTLLPRRVLLGNWVSRFRGSTALVVMVEPVEEHVCLPLPWLSLLLGLPRRNEKGRGPHGRAPSCSEFPSLNKRCSLSQHLPNCSPHESL